MANSGQGALLRFIYCIAEASVCTFCVALLAFGLSAQCLAVEKILLSYDEQLIPDADRAVIFDLVIKVTPTDRWGSGVARGRDANLYWLIRDHYAYYVAYYPKTTLVILHAIQQANNLTGVYAKSGQTVLLPPVPIGGKKEYGFNARLFHYDPEDRCSAEVNAVGQPKTGLPEICGKKSQKDPRRNATLRIIELEMSDELRVALRMPEVADVVRRSVIISSAAPEKQAPAQELKTDDGPTPCVGNVDWLPTSPDLPYWTTLRSTTTFPPESALMTAAQDVQLVIVDWNFGPDVVGHGAKARDVVNLELAKLSLSDLSSMIQTVDLNPNHNEQQLRGLFEHWLDGKNISQKNRQSAYPDSYAWLRSRDKERDDPNNRSPKTDELPRHFRRMTHFCSSKLDHSRNRI